MTLLSKTNPSPFFRQRFRCIAAGIFTTAVLVAIYGCGHGGPEVVHVTGTVTQQGKPIPNIIVNFMPEKGRPSWAITDEKGQYSLKYNREHDGAVTGRHTVWVGPPPPNNPIEEMQGPKALPKNLQKYGSESTTPLRFEVSTDNQVIDIKLDPS